MANELGNFNPLRSFEVGSSIAATMLRPLSGVRVGALGKRPAAPITLYEFESCPFCRKVREACTALDLEVNILPCPKGGQRFRGELQRRAGKQQFPYMVDPNTGREIFESADIIAHLFAEYGAGKPPWHLQGPLPVLAGGFASLLRLQAGTFARPSRPPRQPLELWSFEASPFSRLVREKLCTLEIPYLLHNVGRGSPSRPAFAERSGKMQVPFLVDPNSNVEMFESADIAAYLEERYAAKPGED